MTFGYWLQAQLIAREMSQSDFARKTGAGTGAVSKWISDATDPSPRMIVRIARVLSVPPEQVLLLVADEHTVAETRPVVPSLPPAMALGEAELVSRIAWAVRHWRDDQEAQDTAEQMDAETPGHG